MYGIYQSNRSSHLGIHKKKQMLVGVYLYKGRVSDNPESAETIMSEAPPRHFPNINKKISHMGDK